MTIQNQSDQQAKVTESILTNDLQKITTSFETKDFQQAEEVTIGNLPITSEHDYFELELPAEMVSN